MTIVLVVVVVVVAVVVVAGGGGGDGGMRRRSKRKRRRSGSSQACMYSNHLNKSLISPGRKSFEASEIITQLFLLPSVYI